MNKKIIAIGMLVVFAAMAVSPAVSALEIKTTKLYHKDPSTWDIINPSTHGEFTAKGPFFGIGGSYYFWTFKGINLEPGQEYALVNYQENWPYVEEILGVGTASDSIFNPGLLTIGGRTSDVYWKYWLVPTDHLDMENLKFICWNPSEILFEEIIFT